MTGAMTVALGVVVMLLAGPPDVDSRHSHMWADAFDDAVHVGASSTTGASGIGEDSARSGTEPTHLLRMRAPICPRGGDSLGALTPCPGDPVVPLPECEDRATLPDLGEMTAPDAVVGAWRHVGPPVCASAADITPGMVLSAFRRLPLTPSPLVVQPDRGWALVNKPTVVHADGGPQTLTTTILGTAVTIAPTPTSYAWDFGDGATLTTADPGRPWPTGTLTHTYQRVGTYTIALTTTWSASAPPARRTRRPPAADAARTPVIGPSRTRPTARASVAPCSPRSPASRPTTSLGRPPGAAAGQGLLIAPPWLR